MTGVQVSGAVPGQSSLTAISDQGGSTTAGAGAAQAAGRLPPGAAGAANGQPKSQELVARFATLDLGCGFF